MDLTKDNFIAEFLRFENFCFHINYYKYLRAEKIDRTTFRIYVNDSMNDATINLFNSTIESENDELEKCKELINDVFFNLFDFSHKNDMFFKYCSFDVYSNSFDQQFANFKNENYDVDLLDFLKVEYQTIVNQLNNSLFMTLMNDKSIQFLQNSKQKKLVFLEKKIIQEQKELIIIKNNDEYHIDFKDLTIFDNEIADLSETTATDKIIYLQKLGVLDFLKNKQPFILSTNSLATVLSAITGEKAGTIQPMINPIFSKQVDTKNNPLNSLKAVKKVENQLINIGFNVSETN